MLKQIPAAQILGAVADIAFGDREIIRDRLKALEMLCKNKGLLVHRAKIEGGDKLAEALRKARERLNADG